MKITRSDYETAPGGCVCMKQEMLEYMRDYAQFYYGQVGGGKQLLKK